MGTVSHQDPVRNQLKMNGGHEVRDDLYPRAAPRLRPCKQIHLGSPQGVNTILHRTSVDFGVAKRVGEHARRPSLPTDLNGVSNPRHVARSKSIEFARRTSRNRALRFTHPLISQRAARSRVLVPNSLPVVASG